MGTNTNDLANLPRGKLILIASFLNLVFFAMIFNVLLVCENNLFFRNGKNLLCWNGELPHCAQTIVMLSSWIESLGKSRDTCEARDTIYIDLRHFDREKQARAQDIAAVSRILNISE